MGTQHPLVELASSALGHLALVPRFGESCRGSDALIDLAWVRAPLTVAIGGTVAARSELFNYVCNRKVLDPATRPLGCAALRIRRGKQTKMIAIRDDGSTESHVLATEQADDDALRMRAAATKSTVDERKLALERVERALPRLARARPRGIMIWLWPVWWLLTRRHRRALAERRFTEIAYDQAAEAQTIAEQELEKSVNRIRVERARFFESLRALSSGLSLGGTVREVVLDLGEGPLPEGIDLLELTRPQAGEQVDAIFLVEKDALYAPHTSGGDAPKVGAFADVIPHLLLLLGRARALVLARRARDEIEPLLATLDDDITDTEEGFRVRIERLEAMQIMDPEEFAQAELAKVKPQVSQSIHAVIEHAAAHLGSELVRLGSEWATALSITQNNDQLKHAVGRVEVSAPLDAKRIAEEVRTLIVGGASGAAHDIFPDLLATLRPYGLDERGPQAVPPLPPIEILPSLTNAQASKLSAGLLGGLFKSFESRRLDVQTKAEARIAHLREVAMAEILDAEPRLRTVIEGVLHQQLRAALERQVKWLDRTLAAEREQVAREGIALAPLARMRDRVRSDYNALVDGIAQLEREHPGLAAAATASPSFAGARSGAERRAG